MSIKQMIRNNWKAMALIFLASLLAAGVFSHKSVALGSPGWPVHDISIIVCYKPGGGFDLAARATAPFIMKYLPNPVNVVIQNLAGAGGAIGLRELAKAKPDGHTIGVLDPLEVQVMHIGKHLEKLNIDIKHILWLGRLHGVPSMLVVGSKAGFRNPGDMKGKKVRFGTSGIRIPFQTLVLAKEIGATVQFVNYEGLVEALLALMRGDNDAVLGAWTTSIRQVQVSGGQLGDKLIPMLVTDRVSELDVPTASDLGIKVDGNLMLASYTIAAPLLDPEIRRMWVNTLAKVFNDPGWSAQMRKIGYPPAPLTGDEIIAFYAATLRNMERYGDFVAELYKGK